jgi:DNA-binding IclR family transcriptional regulator
MEAVAESPAPLSLEQIAARTGIPKPTVHRLIRSLVAARVLLREAHAKSYSVGHRLSELALGALTNSSLRGVRHAVLQGLVERIGETCNITTLDGNEIVYIDRVEAGWPLRLHLQPGSRVPIHCTSSGKLFLSRMPTPQRRRLVFGAPLKRYTAKTITDPERLEAELKRIRKTKVSTDDEGFLSGLISVAIPVFDAHRRMIATVAVHAPSARMSLRAALGHVPLLRQAAADLGRVYGDLETPSARV